MKNKVIKTLAGVALLSSIATPTLAAELTVQGNAQLNGGLTVEGPSTINANGGSISGKVTLKAASTVTAPANSTTFQNAEVVVAPTSTTAAIVIDAPVPTVKVTQASTALQLNKSVGSLVADAPATIAGTGTITSAFLGANTIFATPTTVPQAVSVTSNTVTVTPPNGVALPPTVVSDTTTQNLVSTVQGLLGADVTVKQTAATAFTATVPAASSTSKLVDKLDISKVVSSNVVPSSITVGGGTAIAISNPPTVQQVSDVSAALTATGKTFATTTLGDLNAKTLTIVISGKTYTVTISA